MMPSKSASASHPERVAELRREIRGPRRHDAIDRRIVLPLHAIGDGVAGHASQRRDHLLDRDENARHIDRARRAECRCRRFVADDQIGDGRARRAHPHPRASRATGQIASTPESGSRMIPLANDDAALFGLPGRTVTVGSRRLRPSMKPLRVMS